jgi:Integrase core domain
MAKDVKVFVEKCLYCVATIPGDKVPLPLGTQLHATKPNEILHFDFLYIGLSRDRKYQYLLLLKDDLSGYLWLVPYRTADAAATVDALMRWFAVLGIVLLSISDRGSHFKNEVVRRVQKELKAKHHFNSANCLWSNGTIESACKQVIRALLAVLSELKMYADEWPEVVNIVQSVLRFYKDKELNVTEELAQAAEHNDRQLYVVSKILDARNNEQEMFHELLVAWRGFPVGMATLKPYSVMAVDVPDMVAKFMESHEGIDLVRMMRSL